MNTKHSNKILVVEDDELIRTMMKINLESAGYLVTFKKDAEALLSEMDPRQFDLILLDIMLPGISGQDALIKLRKSGIKTPIIMVTARNDIETKINSFDNGADDYLAKPFNMKELLARVKALLRRNL